MVGTAGAARLPDDPPLPAGLDELSRRVLEFELSWTGRDGAKASAIRVEFGVTPARYYQMLSAVLDSPAALRHDPLLVRRLQRVQDARAAARASRTFRIDPQDPTP
ncbi:DUF3263 domain-containing protein [Homoserinibacter sp. GY 40078]|uniref:DUF3263 domain-containing protein n=1 Tax=Homoserinibacter sp. GY 40078 TaxID=2603275 RepID=UPI0011C8FC17|nr:DUF3263 domain-containing protein [Homoserinibacter sp. GY 40078]TXK19351.1 DUF3263 domain-containing protein [Homoserinibacter sp. GY 40078]